MNEFLQILGLAGQNDITERFGETCRAIALFSEKMINLYQSLNSWWENTGIQICKAIYELATPFYDEERRQKLINCYKGWGQFGWTINSEISSMAFEPLPSSQVEADNMMQQYCTIENVSDMLQSISEKGVNRQDLDEAFACYKSGMYKSSALIVFALIDHELISKGFRKTQRNGTPGRLKVGVSAAHAYYKDKQHEFDEAFLFNNLWFLNIMECLVTLFADSDDFQNEPDRINRNFVSHGMSQRTVTEIDCFKVWSALYSWTALLPELEESTE